MMRRVIMLLPTVLLGACASLDLPSIEQSRASVEAARPRITAADSVARNWSATRLPGAADLVTRVRMYAVNRMLDAVAGNRSDDVRIRFLPTKGIVKEDKSVLGVSYTNTVDIEGGELTLNLKTLRFDRFDRNTAEATIEIEGAGRISVSGRHTGVPASASPNVELRIADRITFDVKPADSGMVLITPRAKTVNLSVKLSVTLLQWSVPYTQEVPLQIRDLVPPMRVPVALSTEVPFPVPAAKAGDEKFDYVPFRLMLSRTTVRTSGDVLEVSTDLDFIRK
jgi:hypothetical protein